jgi:hypothetical protein
MIIRELNTNSRFVTVTLNYDELRCVHNSMYEVSRFDDVEKDKDFDKVHKRFIELFALVKYGHIPEFELNLMHELVHKNEN